MNMTCNEIKELTVPYLELDLEPSRVRDVTTHLNGCAGCRAEMEAVRQILVRVKGMAVPDPGTSSGGNFRTGSATKWHCCRTLRRRWKDHLDISGSGGELSRRSGHWASRRRLC